MKKLTKRERARIWSKYVRECNLIEFGTNNKKKITKKVLAEYLQREIEEHVAYLKFLDSIDL